MINKKTEKEDTVNENDNFKYSDAIDYKKPLKKDKRNLMVILKNGHLKKDDGKLVYNIDLKKVIKKQEVTIDAKNGKVLKE